ncbi:COG1361 S-layer family protein [Candidatus Woesearchaeota archaeon]|nr:COG1361 S-layer family protein [Candidatus Woesearchaeota archaeon]
MKKTIFLTLFVLIFSIAYMANAQYVEAPQLNITIMNQDPDPVGPGKYVEVRFKIYNDGVGTAENVVLELLPKYPFSLDKNEDPLRDLGNIPGYGKSKNVMVVKYKIRVDRNAIEGENILHLRYKIGDVWITEEFIINVQTIDATVSIESVETIPEKIEPGKPFEIRFKLKNMADSVMEDVSLKFDLGLSTVDIPSTTSSLSLYDLVPFAPLNSATEKKVRMISPGKEAVFTYDVIAYSSAEPRVYKIPIQIKYYDELDTEYIKNDIVGLIVGTKPDLTVDIDETSLDAATSMGDVIIKFINKGFTDIKFLDVTLGQGEDFEILSSDEVYIGNIDSDDYETAEFKIFVKQDKETKGQERTIILPLSIEYKDANTEEYTKQISLELKLYDPKKLGRGNGNGTMTFVLAIVVILIIFFVYRRIRKKKVK